MNRSLNIIPTPKYCWHTPGKVLSVSEICVVGQQAPVLRHALATLQGITLCSQQDAQVILYADFALVPSGLLDEDDLAVFEEDFAEEQGYILKTVPNGQIVLIAKSQQGCAYGVLTLRQMLGLPVGTFTVRDWPDFRNRGIKWLLWAELGAWSFDFGDGVDAIIRRMQQNLDQLFLYKINFVYADGFGFSVDRFEGYTEVMRTVSDYAHARGIKICTGGYAMSYGMVAHLHSYQGRDFYNRKSYPDGEIYGCLGTYVKNTESVQWRSLDRGTCLSNEALFELKMEELTEYIRKTHITGLLLHNMDAHDIAAGWWATRCDTCRKRWPNPDLFARDGAAGAIAEYIDKIMRRLRTVKDGDYDAARDLTVRISSPGYMYTFTTDEDFDIGIRFWAAVSEYVQERDNVIIGFREQHFYHNKPVCRADTVKKSNFRLQTQIGFFNGCDGFYDDKQFTTTAALSYVMKGYTGISLFNGNAFQEPLQVFNAEYLWNSENSGFYNVSPRPANYEEYNALFEDMLNSVCRPAEVYGEGGFLDVICQKLYGQEAGTKLARIYKLCGDRGEPPIPYASNVDIFTNYSKVVYPMAWETPMKKDDIAAKTERFHQCSIVSRQAADVLTDVLNSCPLEQMLREKLTVFKSCYAMGATLCDLLYRYMLIYAKLHDGFENGAELSGESILALKPEIAAFTKLVNDPTVRPVDKFEGIFIRRKEMADFLDYNTDMMLLSIRQGKRIPDGTRSARTRDWW